MTASLVPLQLLGSAVGKKRVLFQWLTTNGLCLLGKNKVSRVPTRGGEWRQQQCSALCSLKRTMPAMGTPTKKIKRVDDDPLPAETNEFYAAHALRLDRVRQLWQNLRFRLGGDPRRPPAQRKRIVILGTGWASMSFLTNVDVALYDVVIVSPRNYFTVTPLLPSVCAGTLSPRSCFEPVRNKMLRGGQKVMNFYEGWAVDLEPDAVRRFVAQTRPTDTTLSENSKLCWRAERVVLFASDY